MTQLTLGQKIAARRKLAGLSQENLAEKLDVSRQAVSKWESDNAIPEIDKLIVLSKLFDVSIGWLLGAESEPSASTNFGEEQLKTIEELISRYYPKKRSFWWMYVACAVLLIAITVSFVYYRNQVTQLKNDNLQAITQIEVLSKNNGTLQAQLEDISDANEALQLQIGSMSQLLDQQSDSNKLITDFFRIEVSADTYLENVTTVLYMRPKVYKAENKALLSIQNPKTGYTSTVECTWSQPNQVYIARYTVPAHDGYKVSFLLVNEYGFEEENLLIRDPGFAYTGTYCGFHLDPLYYSSSTFFDTHYIYTDGQRPLSDYEFNEAIYTPHIFADTAIAYKDIRIVMKHNGRIIWEQSYLDEFYTAAGGSYLNAGNVPVEPNIRIPIPMAKIGDELELYLEAETVNGGAQTQNYYTLLQRVQIRDIKELEQKE